MERILRADQLVIFWPGKSPSLCKRYGDSNEEGWVRAIYNGSVTDLPACNVLEPPSDRLPVNISSEFGRA
jgi:hypothetical protein